MNKCWLCDKGKTIWFCITAEGVHTVACISCAVKHGLKLIEEVKEVEDGYKGVEEGSSHKG